MKKGKKLNIVICIIIFVVFLFCLLFDIITSVNENYIQLRYRYGESVIQPLAAFCIALFIPVFSMLFLKEAVFKAWIKFAMYSLPIYIALLWLFTGSGEGSDGFYSSGGYGSASGEFFVLFFSVLYLIISLIFITKKAKKFGGMLELETTMNSKDNLDSFITKKEKMDFSNTELIKQAIVSAEGNKNDEEIKETLLEQGFQEKDITKAFDEIKKEVTNKK